MLEGWGTTVAPNYRAGEPPRSARGSGRVQSAVVTRWRHGKQRGVTSPADTEHHGGAF